MLQHFVGMLELNFRNLTLCCRVMEFCLGCGADLPKATKAIRTLISESTAASTLRVGVILVWSSLMKEVVGNQGFSYFQMKLILGKCTIKVFEPIQK